MRNSTTAAQARYTDAELNLAIERATTMLGEYFFGVSVDTSKTWATEVYTYTYSYPVEDIFRVEFLPPTGPPSVANDWDFDNGSGILYFNDAHTEGQTIRVWYERHPYPYPGDATLNSGPLTTASTTFTSSVSLVDWPDSGYLKIANEIMLYSAINRTTDEFTVTRAQLGTTAVAHADALTISFVNKVDKPIFYNGVRDVAIMYLNRMRIIDAPTADIAGNVTVMREINEGLDGWIRKHRMRQSRPIGQQTRRAIPMKTKRRG